MLTDRVSVSGADSRSLAPHSLRSRDLARCSQHTSFNRRRCLPTACRCPALIRGRSHPTRCARGTWLAASNHTSFNRRRCLPTACRCPALIRGRSHPTRCARGTWLAAHSALPPIVPMLGAGGGVASCLLGLAGKAIDARGKLVSRRRRYVVYHHAFGRVHRAPPGREGDHAPGFVIACSPARENPGGRKVHVLELILAFDTWRG